MEKISHLKYDTGSYQYFTGPARVEKDFRILAAILEGIRSDGEISPDEQEGLRRWLKQVDGFRHRDPYRQTIMEIEAALSDHFLSEDELDDIRWLCNTYVHHQGYYDLVTAGMQQLIGLLVGMNLDNQLDEKEIHYLSEWLDQNEYLRNSWPYDELSTLVMQVLSDNKVTPEEIKALQAFANTLISGNTMELSATMEMLHQGFCQVDPEIVLEGSSFCITGISTRYSRQQMANIIESRGGRVITSVSKQLNYLVVCDEKNACWAYTCYGRKVERAVALRKEGHRLAIIHELDLLDAMVE